MLRAMLLTALAVIPLELGLILLDRAVDLPFAAGYALFALIVAIGVIMSAELEPDRRRPDGFDRRA